MPQNFPHPHFAHKKTSLSKGFADGTHHLPTISHNNWLDHLPDVLKAWSTN